MNGFLLNMINRHQDRVDKVQPRIRSMFEPESASAVSEDNAFAGVADTMIKKSLDAGSEKQVVFSKSPGPEKSTPENSPSTPLTILSQQPVQTDEGFRAPDLHSNDRNRMDFMKEKIQSVLAQLGREPEPPEHIKDKNGLQKPVPSVETDQTAITVVSNEQGLNSRIDETLSRLKNQTNNPIEGNRRLQDHAQLLPANPIKIEDEQFVTLPAQSGIKGEQSAEPLNKAINNQAQFVNTPNSLDGALQIPDWLTAMQTNLNNKWREINAKYQSEPVINVTIGRVEVRAINTEPAKPGTTSNKPRGVLSLDDYLKQRESKGRI
jgi:hypothetical protein